MKNPRIATLRLDAKFILRFLRFKKFSIPMAQEAMERYLVLRKYFFEGQFIYQNFDYKLPALLDLINKGWVSGVSVLSRQFLTKYLQVWPAVWSNLRKFNISASSSPYPNATISADEFSSIAQRFTIHRRTSITISFAATALSSRHFWKTKKIRSADVCTSLTVQDWVCLTSLS